MATLREVKKRIRTVISTQRITKAMEMVAAAKLRRSQEKVEQTRPYSKKMDEMLSPVNAAYRKKSNAATPGDRRITEALRPMTTAIWTMNNPKAIQGLVLNRHNARKSLLTQSDTSAVTTRPSDIIKYTLARKRFTRSSLTALTVVTCAIFTPPLFQILSKP